MRQKLEPLLELQKIETDIERISAALAAAPEKIAALDAKQTSLQEAYDSEISDMDVLKKKYRSMESDLQADTARISKRQANLSDVKTNKEYQALLKEIDEIKEKNSAAEDEMILCLEEMESLEIDLGEKRKVLKQMTARITAEKGEIDREAETNKNLLAEAERLQGELSGAVDTGLMTDYLRVKKLVKSNRVVVPVLQAICQGCHLNIPPQMFIELQRGDRLKFCPHCDRILYWDELLES